MTAVPFSLRWMASLLLLCAGVGGVSGVGVQELWGQERSPDDVHYLDVMAQAFSVPLAEATRLAGEGIRLEELPVVLFLGRETGLAPSAILALRRAGTSWADLARRSGLSADRLLVELPEAVGSPAARALAGRIRATPRSEWNTLALTDAEIVLLVHIRVLSRHLGRDAVAVTEATALGEGWSRVVRILTTGRQEGSPHEGAPHG
jgi:lambda repressor-like predicted transcriptional regulator